MLPAMLLVVVAAVGLLSACTSNPVGAVVTPSPRPAVTTPAPVARPTTPPPTQDAAAATAVRVRCAKLLPKDVAAQVAPDLAVQHGWTPPTGSPSARLQALGGTTCAWTDPAGDTLELSVAEPSMKDAIALKDDLVERSNSVPTYGGEAYFDATDHMGEVDAFRHRTWILARSNRFFEPGDAIEVIGAADRALGFAHRTAADRTADPTVTPLPGATPTPTVTAN